jgi:hypothetical protein
MRGTPQRTVHQVVDPSRRRPCGAWRVIPPVAAVVERDSTSERTSSGGLTEADHGPDRHSRDCLSCVEQVPCLGPRLCLHVPTG